MFDNYGSQPAQPPPPPPAPTRVIRFDKGYFNTTPGILKLVQILCNIVGFICIKVSSQWVSAIFYNILYWAGNIITIFLLLMYMFHFVEKFDQWPWLKCEFFFCAAMALTYVGCSIFATTIGESVGYAVGVSFIIDFNKKRNIYDKSVDYSRAIYRFLTSVGTTLPNIVYFLSILILYRGKILYFCL